MPFEPGKKKTGGRKKGTPNKRTQEVEAILAALKCNPLEGLAKIANGEALACGNGLDAEERGVRPTFEQRLGAYKELAQYVFPKRKALEHSGSIGTHEASLEDLE